MTEGFLVICDNALSLGAARAARDNPFTMAIINVFHDDAGWVTNVTVTPQSSFREAAKDVKTIGDALNAIRSRNPAGLVTYPFQRNEVIIHIQGNPNLSDAEKERLIGIVKGTDPTDSFSYQLGGAGGIIQQGGDAPGRPRPLLIVFVDP